MCLVSVSKGRFSQCVCVCSCVCLCQQLSSRALTTCSKMSGHRSAICCRTWLAYSWSSAPSLSHSANSASNWEGHTHRKETHKHKETLHKLLLCNWFHLVQVWFVLDFKGPAINPFVTSLTAHFLKHMFFFSADFLKKRKRDSHSPHLVETHLCF